MSGRRDWEPVAIVGTACRAAAVQSRADLVDVVTRGSCEVSEVTPDRWRAQDFHAAEAGPGTGVSRWSGQLVDPYAFDADFFRIPRKEAAHMDPQQRLVLEESWHCIEDAGVGIEALQEAATDVIVGVASRDHLQNQLPMSEVNERTTFGGSDYMLANRVSHSFGLRGASFSLDAACASSLAALHLGVRSLQLRESDFVLAGGVCVNLHPWKFISYSHAHMLSPTGRCHTLSQEADGFVSGDGVVMLLLRRLDDALAAGDHVHGTIIGSAMNSAGRRRSLTAPTAGAQDALLRSALASGDVDPRSVQYLEMHGTGTPVGDPIEVSAIRSAYGADRSGPLYLGSVKANVGHTEAAAGGLGVVKVLGMMRAGTIPPCAGLGKTNPLLPLGQDLMAPVEATPWELSDAAAPRRAAVSSFGAGGSNAHVIIEQGRVSGSSAAVGPEGVPVLVSGKTAVAVDVLTQQVAAALNDAHLGDAALTLATGRQAMPLRRGGLARHDEDVARALSGPTRTAHSGWWFQVGTVDTTELDLAGAAAAFDRKLREWSHEDTTITEVVESYRAGEDTAATRCLHTMLVVQRLGALVGTVGLRPVGEGWAACAQASGMMSVAAALRAVEDPAAVVGLRPPAVVVDAGPGWPAARPDVITWAEARELFHAATADTATLDAWIVRALEVAGTVAAVHQGLARWRATLAEVGTPLPHAGPELDGTSWPDRAGHVLAAVACASVLERQSRRAGLPSALEETEDALACLVRLAADCADPSELLAQLRCEDDLAGTEPAGMPFDVPQRAGVVQAWRTSLTASTSAVPLRRAVCDLADRHGILLVPEGSTDAEPICLPWAPSRAELLPALVEAWTRGVDVAWPAWFADGAGSFRKTPMPTYPFERVTLRVTDPVTARTERPSPEGTPAAQARTYQLQERWELVAARGDGATACRAVLVTDQDGVSRAASLWEMHEGRRLLHSPADVQADAEGSVDLTGGAEWSQQLARLEDEGDPVETVVILAAGSTAAPGSTPGRHEGHVEPHWSALAALSLAAAATRSRPRRVLRIVQVLVGDCGPSAEAAYALGPALHRESSTVSFVSVQVSAEAQDADLATAVRAGTSGAPSPRLAVEAGQVRAISWSVRDVLEQQRALHVSPGVHVVTGGAGGLGTIFAQALLAGEGVTVVLIGRAPKAPPAVRALLGARLDYRSCDVTDAAAVRAVFRSIVRDRGAIRGVIHAAGVLTDALVSGLDPADLLRALAPKVLGLENIDLATADQPLDYLVLCSSLAVTFGNAGQTSYAFANACMDGFAARREAMRLAGQRPGRCVSVQWPLWEQGGMRLDPSHPLLASGALAGMPAAQGIAALTEAISGHGPSLVRLVHGDPDQASSLTSAWQSGPPQMAPVGADADLRATAAGEARQVDATDHDPGQLARSFVRQAFAEIMSAGAHEVDLDAGLEDYGIDSIHVLSFARRLEVQLRCQEPALLFECRTLEQAAQTLAKRHPEALRAWARAEQADGRWPSSDRLAAAAGPAPREEDGCQRADVEMVGDDAIAVVGMAGRYPGAPDLTAFWDNLHSGREGIHEIPAERLVAWERAGGRVESGSAERYCPTGGFLDDVEMFDPMFFRISTADAMIMDPQERLLLENTWHALEDAGMPPSSLGTDDDRGRAVGVFVGATTATYDMHGPAYWARGEATFPLSMPWSLANRVSYCLDLQGPSVAVDTACASSLTAVHLAVASLRRGECDLAIAAGVNLYLHPWKYDYLSSRQMVSPTGICSAFGAAADGFVPGEGVGTLVLKPLAQARRDGDRIRGVIRGTSTNHGGRARGYMVPRPQRQAAAIRAALQDAHVDADTITYVETHGTGTRLGDPVEARGISDALRPDQGPPLRIGSVKPQIGHLEGAAGIAGMTKVLLQMEQGLLAPSLHADPPNDEVDLGSLGLQVVGAVAPWQRLTGPDGRPVPRRAGVSSFGAGGTNAHVVLEEHLTAEHLTAEHLTAEHLTAEPPAGAPAGALVFCLSAGSEGQLGPVYARLAAWIAQNPGTDPGVLAYALQVRREPLPHRVAVVARDLAELACVLEEFAKGRRPPHLLVGTRDPQARRAASSEAAGLGPAATAAQLATVWAAGAAVDWATRWPAPQPHLVLPAYPFARQRVELPPMSDSGPEGRAGHDAAAPGRRHLSGWIGSGERTVMLRSSDPLLRDHQVRGTAILPAVGILEAVLAVAADCGRHAGGLTDVVLAEPVLVTGSLALTITITAKAGKQLVTVTSDGPSGPRTHAHAVLLPSPAASAPARVDLDEVRRRCPTEVDPGDVYRTHEQRGLQLGPSYRGLSTVHLGDGELLARIGRPASATWGRDMRLHPAVFDSCLQSSVVLTGEDVLRLPFSIGHCEVYGALADADVHAHITLTKTPPGARCFDVTIADAGGRLLVALSDVWVRDVPPRDDGAGTPTSAQAAPEDGLPEPLTLALATWTPLPHREGGDLDAPAVVLADHMGLERTLADTIPSSRHRVRGSVLDWVADAASAAAALESAVREVSGDTVQVVLLLPPATSPEQDHARGATQLCSAVAHLLKVLACGPHTVRLLCVHHETQSADDPRVDGLTGLLRTAQAELSRLTTTVLRVAPSEDVGVATRLVLLRPDWEQDYRYDGQALSARTWAPCPAPVTASMPGGVHLVAGGNGGLGRRLVEDLVSRSSSTVVVASRSTSGVRELLAQVGGSVQHVVADVSTPHGARKAVETALAVTGRLDGVFHCAAVLKDEFALAMTPDGIQAVLGAKVDAAVCLDQATAGLDLQVFCLISSMASIVANPGQGAYAFANGWLDGFARWRSRQPDRLGDTRSVLLPFLTDGGMVMPDEHLVRLTGAAGLRASTVAQVLDRLPAALQQSGPVVALAPSDWVSGTGLTNQRTDETAVSATAPQAAGAGPSTVEAFLLHRVAVASKTDHGSVDPLTELSVFGLDSLSFAQLASETGDRFGMSVSPAVFFEFTTVRELADHLGGLLPAPPAAPQRPAAPGPAPAPRRSQGVQSSGRADHQTSSRAGAEDAVAIIGMAGRFPGSADVTEFWRHLERGDDLVTEIPESRWDWRISYDPQMSRPGTTNSKWGGFIPDIADFDHAFFGISPREARLMDPQHRLFLQTAYQAIEDAGYRPSQLSRGRTGVFAGVASHDYFELVRASGLPLEGYSATGMFHSLLPNRVSYYLNLSGPSFPIDAACSSSLVAIHTAMESLRSGVCDTAIAGGANLLISPTIYVAFSRAGMLSPTGRCRTFDQAADGYVRGEGVAAVLLKPLARAVADGDNIHGVLRASAVNHGGKVNTLTTPNPVAQATLIETAVRAAGVPSASLDYVEMHGTGTALGDPIEVNGLKRALTRLQVDEEQVRSHDLVVGSVKSVVGHLEAAAGMAGLFKVLLAMKHGVIPGNLHLNQLNEHIDLRDAGIRIADRATPWPQSADHPRTAGISSFGFGGINAHVVIQEAAR